MLKLSGATHNIAKRQYGFHVDKNEGGFPHIIKAVGGCVAASSNKTAATLMLDLTWQMTTNRTTAKHYRQSVDVCFRKKNIVTTVRSHTYQSVCSVICSLCIAEWKQRRIRRSTTSWRGDGWRIARRLAINSSRRVHKILLPWDRNGIFRYDCGAVESRVE